MYVFNCELINFLKNKTHFKEKNFKIQIKFSMSKNGIKIFVKNITKLNPVNSNHFCFKFQSSVKIRMLEFCYLILTADCHTFFWNWEENQNKPFAAAHSEKAPNTICNTSSHINTFKLNSSKKIRYRFMSH